MKIAFVTNTCWNIYNFRNGLANHFLARGDEVIAIAPRDEYTIEIEKWGIRFIETPLDGTGTNPFREVRYLIRLIHIFQSEEIEICLSFTIKSNIYSSIAGRIAGVQTICNVSGLGTVFLVKGIIGRLAISLYKIAFRYSDFIFFQNQDDEKLFTSIIPLKSSQFKTLPGSGINLTDFAYSCPVFEKPTKFLMISRLIIEKGVREFADASLEFKDDINVSFTLVGNFNEKHSRSISEIELNEWIDDKRLTYIPHTNKIKRIIQNHEVIILPSYREGTPRTLLEAAAIGRAILTSNVPGCKEVVNEDYNGFLFDAKNSQSIVEKVKKYLALSLDIKLQFSSNSRLMVEEKFDESLIINEYVDAIHRISGQA